MAKVYLVHESLRGIPITSNEEIKQYVKEGLIVPLNGKALNNGSEITFKTKLK